PATLTAGTFFLKDAGGNLLSANVSYDPTTYTAALTTRSFLLTSTTYTATVVGGASGTVVKDANGRALAASYTWSFTTAAQAAIYPNIFRSTAAPQTASAGGSGGSLEVGVKFTSDVSGVITGIRFYKGSLNTGTHVGHLWTASGQLLNSATFTNETASGW